MTTPTELTIPTALVAVLAAPWIRPFNVGGMAFAHRFIAPCLGGARREDSGFLTEETSAGLEQLFFA